MRPEGRTTVLQCRRHAVRDDFAGYELVRSSPFTTAWGMYIGESLTSCLHDRVATSSRLNLVWHRRPGILEYVPSTGVYIVLVRMLGGVRSFLISVPEQCACVRVFIVANVMRRLLGWRADSLMIACSWGQEREEVYCVDMATTQEYQRVGLEELGKAHTLSR